MTTGGNISAATQATGANYTTYSAQRCTQLTFLNDTGVTIEFDTFVTGINGTGTFSGTPVPVFSGTYYTVYGIQNANEVKFRRFDQSGTTVTVKARWEGEN